jgi:hypothetical protein
VRACDLIRTRRRFASEKGQATTEFALILFPLLLIVAGIIQFGIALNYWLDLQRIANQGARWAVVNNYPGCTRNDPNTIACGTTTTLQEYIACQPIPGPLNPSVTISFPNGGTPKSGDPVALQVHTSFDLLPILGFAEIGLTGEATMRLEQTPTRFRAADNLTEGQATCP